MVDVFGFNVPVNTPSFGIGSNVWWYFFFFLIICIIGGVVIYFIHRFKIYRYKIIVFENVASQGYTPSYKDRARLVKVGDGGVEILQLMKRRLFRSSYGRKMGVNTYWYAVGQDGYWYNFVLGDIDAKLGMLDIEPVDRDMRLLYEAIRSNAITRYDPQGFLAKYGVQVFSAIVILIMFIGVWFVLDKIAEVSSTTASNLDVVGQVADKMANVASSMDRICSGGSGIIPAG